MIYFIIYSIIVLPIFIIINTINSKTIKTLHNLFKNNTVLVFATAILILSLAGVPPLTGFIPKLIIITKLIETNYTVLVFLLLGAYINLYYYLNISFNILLTRNNINSKHVTKETISKPVLIIISTAILGMFPIII
jgi:NADH-ubiquinone oxidoreductase chain 2